MTEEEEGKEEDEAEKKEEEQEGFISDFLDRLTDQDPLE